MKILTFDLHSFKLFAFNWQFKLVGFADPSREETDNEVEEL